MNFNLLMKYCLNEINLIIKTTHSKYKKNIKYSNEYYLTMIFLLLNDTNNWSFLSKLKNYKSDFKYHYKTIYNKFRLWTSLDVFKNAFYNLKTKNKTNMLLIDATSINNKYGSENVVINSEYKKKKITKLSLITNTNKFIYSVTPFDINNKYKNYSTSVHDVKMICKSINQIKNINNESKYFYLIDDKAYKSKEELKLKNKKIIMITPDKINTINKNFINKRIKLRVQIENVNCFIKKYERIALRKDKKINYFMSFVYMSCIINN